MSGDFTFEDWHGNGRGKVVEDLELEAILSQGSCQTREELSKSLGIS